MTRQEECFETDDTNIAAWLITNKVSFRGTVLSKDGYTSFRFKSDERITELIDSFNGGDACSARDFSANYRFLNVQIKQARRNGVAK